MGPGATYTAHQHLCMPKVPALPLGLGWHLPTATGHPRCKGRQAGRVPRAGRSSLGLRAELLVLFYPRTAALTLALWYQPLPAPSPAPALGVPFLQATAPAAQTQFASTAVGLARGHGGLPAATAAALRSPHVPRELPALPVQHQPPAIARQPPKAAAPLMGTAENRRVQLPQVTDQQITLTHRDLIFFFFFGSK